MEDEAADWYAEEIHAQLKSYAAWEPSVSFPLGAYGTMDGGIFRWQGKLQGLGGPASEPDVQASQPVWVYSTQGAVDVGVDAGAEADAAQTHVRGQVKLAFTRERALYFRLVNYRRVFTKNIEEVRSFVLDLNRAGLWEGHHVVVTEVVRAEQGIVLFSNKKGDNVSFEVEARSDVIDIGNPELKLKMKGAKAIGLSFEMNKPFTPLLGVKHVKWRVLRPDIFETRKLAGSGAPQVHDEAEFVDYEWKRSEAAAVGS